MEARLAKLGNLMVENNTKKDIIGTDTQVKLLSDMNFMVSMQCWL